MEQKMVNININFDSLFFPLSIDRQSMTDPFFIGAADRFFQMSAKYNFKYSIFIVGKDLENPEVFARVKSWSEAGHEIGNHSYTHNPNLGSLPREQMEYEVMKSHELITKCTGKEPRGFISPSWSTSGDLIDILIKNNYLYDTSIFPSYFQYLVLLKLMILTKGEHKNFHPSFSARKDKWAFFFAPKKPYFIRPDSLIKKQSDGLLMMPLPVATPLRFPVWHTMYFIFGKKFTNWLLKRAILENEYFYYLLHPRDLADYEKDLPQSLKDEHHDEMSVFESLELPIDKKIDFVENALRTIAQSGRQFVTLETMAEKIIQDLK